MANDCTRASLSSILDPPSSILLIHHFSPTMSDITNLLTRRSSVIAELAAMNSTASGGKPSYSIDGQQVDHVAYRQSLYDELRELNAQISVLQGPFEEQGVGIT
jgi:hypothetical protein